MKKKHAFVRKAISAIAAFSLVATMCPAEALAATSADNVAEPAATEQVAPDPQTDITSAELPIVAAASSASAATDAADAAPAADQATSDADAAQAALAESAAAQASSATAAQPAADVEMLTAQVNLTSQASTLIASAGLTYAINPDEPGTASLVAISNQALEGALVIPEKVYSGADAYTVTGICAEGGGSLKIRPAI